MIGVLEIPRSGAGLKLLRALMNHSAGFVLITDDITKYHKAYGPNSLFSKLTPDQVLTVDNSLDANAVVSAIKKKGLSFKGLISNLDRFVLVLAQVGEVLGIPFHHESSILSAYDKAKSRIRSDEMKLNIPEYQIYRSSADAAEFLRKHNGCVVKASRGTGSEFVRLVKSESELLKAISDFQTGASLEPNEIVLERYVNGPLYSAETISFSGEHTVLGFTDRILGTFPHFAELGESFPAIFPEAMQNELTGFVKNVLDGFEIKTGICHVEFILSNTGPVLVELNPRIAGAQIGSMISMAYDIDIYKILIDLHLGIAPPRFAAPTSGVAYRDLYLPVKGRLKGISGCEDVIASPGITELVIKDNIVGSVLAPAKDWTGSVGYILSSAPNSQLARNYLESALRLLDFDIEAC